MTRDLKNDEQPSKKAKQIRPKSLATKLAILLHLKDHRTARMPSNAPPGPSLFGRNGSRKYLNAAERRRFRAELKVLGHKERLFCEVLLWSGGRISEVLALTPRAVDLDAGDIALLTLKRRKQGVVRQVPIPRTLIRELGRFRGRDSDEIDDHDVDQRFWSWSRTTAWRLIRRVMHQADISGLAATPKGLRHSFGVAAFQANVPPHLVQRWLGHASFRTTAIYADVLGKEERQFAARMWRSR